MPLPHPPGYQPPRQTRVQRRRVLLAAVVFALLAGVLLVLGRRAAETPGTALPPASPERALLVVVAAGACGAWGEVMRQLTRVARSRDPQDQDLPPQG
ncbi:MAG: hypothetical protein VKK62_07170 [Synechococcaceae cyanobacterium]|nr:hypothetical protein [Synechococcaceae cyanobacterium]